MESSKKSMRTKLLQNDQEIVEFMLETDGELSDLSDSDFEDIMDATDVSSDEKFSVEEPRQPDPDTSGPSAPKKRARTRSNNAKKAKKGLHKYSELCWTSTEPWQDIYLMDSQA